KRIEAVASCAGVEQIIPHHWVNADRCRFDSNPSKHQEVIFDILVDELGVRVFKNWLEGPRNHFPRQSGLPYRTCDWHVIPGPFLPTDGPADDFGLHRITAGRFEIETE